MGKIKKILIRLSIVILVLYGGFSVYLQLFAKGHISQMLSAAISKKVEIRHLIYRFPFELQAYDVVIDDIFSAEGLSVKFKKKIYSSQQINIERILLIGPRINILRNQKVQSGSTHQIEQENLPIFSPEGGRVSIEKKRDDIFPELESKETDDFKYVVKIDNVLVEKGKVFSSVVFSGKDTDLRLENIDLKAESIFYPLKKEKIVFDFKGNFEKGSLPFPAGDIKCEGWVNILKKDMDVKINVFSEKGKRIFDSSLVSENNDVLVSGQLDSRDFLKRSNRQKEEQFSSVEAIASKALSFLNVDIGLKFSFNTKMDDFKITNIAFSGNVGKMKLEK